MRVLHLITSLADGGAEGVLYRLCTHDSANQHSVVSMMDAGKYSPLLKAAGVSVQSLGMTRGRVSLRGVIKLWQILRTERPDAVQTWMYHADLLGGVLARMAGVRKVFWGIRNSNLELGNSRWSTILIAHLNAFLSRFVPTRIICCAERARTIHVTLGYAKEKCVVIPNGCDVQLFQNDQTARQKLRSEWGVDAGMPLIGMVARFDAQKDFDNLLASLAILKQQSWVFRCVLVGHGLNTANVKLHKSLEQNHLTQNVILLDQRSDIPAVMSALDLHVLSSAFGEGFPNVLAEAMACGTPCIATDVGDAAKIVGETGWIVSPRDAKALAISIESALLERQNEPLVWAKRQHAAREQILRSYKLEDMIASYLQVWGG
ncbi:MAG TPA: glycosyltransferase [Burkholderiaceae bacterium]|nr:glycosyltransferase [Burkholderiaceae bacterium]